jgi:predicted nucleotidyltransferase
MSSIVRKFIDSQLLATPPPFIYDGLDYEVIMGSEAYAVSSGGSDRDIYGFATPPLDYLFPSLRKEVQGFGPYGPSFEQYNPQHIIHPDTHVEHDFAIYNIGKYFLLTMNGNPNMIDSLFVPDRCLLYTSKVGKMVRKNRKLFLSKKVWHTFKGYAYSQVSKMKSKNPEPGSKRREMIEEYGYDVKFGYHVIRLIAEAEQILEEGDLDLERNREQLKSIRRGEWAAEDIEAHFKRREIELEALYLSSKLQYSPDVDKIHGLLLSCLEERYGSLSRIISQDKGSGLWVCILRAIKSLTN